MHELRTLLLCISYNYIYVWLLYTGTRWSIDVFSHPRITVTYIYYYIWLIHSMHTVPMLVLSHFYLFTHTCMWYTYIASCRPWSVHWYVFMYIIIIILQLDAFYIIYISPLCVSGWENSRGLRAAQWQWGNCSGSDHCLHCLQQKQTELINVQYCTVPSVSEYNYISIYVVMLPRAHVLIIDHITE